MAVELLVGGNYSAARLCYALWTETKSTAVHLNYMDVERAMRGEYAYKSLPVQTILQETSVNAQGVFHIMSNFSLNDQSSFRSCCSRVIPCKTQGRVSNPSLQVLTLVNGCSSTSQRWIPGGKPCL